VATFVILELLGGIIPNTSALLKMFQVCSSNIKALSNYLILVDSIDKQAVFALRRAFVKARDEAFVRLQKQEEVSINAFLFYINIIFRIPSF
jgi:hypothetical protein